MDSLPAADSLLRPQSLDLHDRDFRKALLSYVATRVGSPFTAEDLVQSILLKASRQVGSVREQDKLRSWVYRLAHNSVVDYFRAHREFVAFDDTLHGEPVSPRGVVEREAEDFQEQLSAYVRGVVDGLPPIYRDAIRSVEYEGRSQVELAKRLGLSVSTAKSRIQRARSLVREEMERCCWFQFDRYGRILDCKPKH